MPYNNDFSLNKGRDAFRFFPKKRILQDNSPRYLLAVLILLRETYKKIVLRWVAQLGVLSIEYHHLLKYIPVEKRNWMHLLLCLYTFRASKQSGRRKSQND